MLLRTRFAPSPTGYLHIGGARTALYCWLYAQKHGGQFALRIEDTDRERSTNESIQAILDAMDWLGLNYDEGPIYQTQRFDRYAEVVAQLLSEGKAYRCTCSKERLETLRETQMANQEKPRYDGHCRDREVSAEEPHVVRFKNPTEGVVSFFDFIRGEITVANSELDDLIIARSDGTPTYNFTVVVDDWDMNMTHVIRGDDHINNTPRQINVFKALGAEPPVYGHVPMILGSDGKRLSKRHGAVSVMQYRDEGFLPQALLNYLVRLGWSHGDQEIFSLGEMIDYFDVAHINRAPASFDPEKLRWINAHYIKTLPVSELEPALQWQYDARAVDTHHGPAVADVIELYRERAHTLREMAELTHFFYEYAIVYDEKTVNKVFNLGAVKLLQVFMQKLQAAAAFDAPNLHELMHETIAECEVGFGKLGQPLRLAITGSNMSPPMNEVMALLGKETCLHRISEAVRHIQEQHA
ncbi:MAG: glutamate--tRNA ligase [Gammaproteobacteria bacterium CG11_big_fil_rev_8_21_14_0_20_46_22]|nr:MAG: glutamate--tRNA ligase [Gammaproteobacteria bacterium CG12_big_fil_rev_8_21_14_0_65_46_12]PIR10851.1 MAG: glutamate--tRNA ligase [Gammaproteobacteria bacterium CG11_big_fil_rev_8_21_14_0_20_46_22]